MINLNEAKEGRGSKNNIKFLRGMLVDCIYKSNKRLDKAIRFAKSRVQYEVDGDKYRKMDDVDYLKFLVNLGIGAIKPLGVIPVNKI